MRQLAIGGRMVVPFGSDPHAQELVRITRIDGDDTSARISLTSGSSP